ncbi:MAG TPA: DUF4157 domain-containing protein [Pyrinomonadaceae bacterium]|jgi:hypothetical protein
MTFKAHAQEETHAAAHARARTPALLPTQTSTALSGPAATVFRMQRAYGNRAVQRWLNPNAVRRKCACGATHAPAQPCGACADAALRRAPAPGDAASAEASADAPGLVQTVLASPGTPLDAQARAFAESRLGADFGGVRVHTDASAAESARAVAATAYTVGRHVVFDAGQYEPRTEAGQRLLLHELVHTMQQDAAAAPRLDTALSVSDPAEPAEREADAVADAALRAQPAAPAQRAAPQVARQAPQPAPAPAQQADAAAQPGATEPPAKVELKDEDLDRWLSLWVMMLVASQPIRPQAGYVRRVLDQRAHDPDLGKAFAAARKKVSPNLQHPHFAAVLALPGPASLSSFFAVRALPIINPILTPGAQDVLNFIERRFVRDAHLTTLDLLGDAGQSYKETAWVYDDYPRGSTLKENKKGPIKVTVVGGTIVIAATAVSPEPEKPAAAAAAPAPAQEGAAQEGAAKKESRSIVAAGEITIKGGQATTQQGADKPAQIAPDETIKIVNRKQNARVSVVGAVLTTRGKDTILTGGTATFELAGDTQATFVGPHEPKAQALAGEMQRLLPEMKPNWGQTAVLHEAEFNENLQDWWGYIKSELDDIPGEPGKKLNRLALPAFVAMRAHARRDGITLDVLSSDRNFETARKHAADAGNSAKVAAFSNHMLGLAIDFALSHPDLTPPKPKDEAAAPAQGDKAAAPKVARKRRERPGYLEYDETLTSMVEVIDMRHSPVHKWLFLHAHKYNFHPYHNEPWHWEYNVEGLRAQFVTNVCRSKDVRNEPTDDGATCLKILTEVVELLGDINRVRQAAARHRKWLAEEEKKQKQEELKQRQQQAGAQGKK